VENKQPYQRISIVEILVGMIIFALLASGFAVWVKERVNAKIAADQSAAESQKRMAAAQEKIRDEIVRQGRVMLWCGGDIDHGQSAAFLVWV